VLPPGNSFSATLSLNTNLYPTNITDVRQAIVHAINQSEIAQKIFHGYLYKWVGPEFPTFPDYFNLGTNKDPQSYNLTLASQYLAEAGFPNGQGLPTITYYCATDFPFTVTMGEIVQADLSQIGINVNIVSMKAEQLFSPYVATWQYLLSQAPNEGNIAVQGGAGYAPITLSPSDPWHQYVALPWPSQDWAGYTNPTVQKCSDAFYQTTDQTLIKSLCTAAQNQLNNDQPYYWLGMYGLMAFDGTPAWKTGSIHSFLVDPIYGGQDTTAIINTIIPG
jgi:ABC-type transport system substrate-binding protein